MEEEAHVTPDRTINFISLTTVHGAQIFLSPSKIIRLFPQVTTEDTQEYTTTLVYFVDGIMEVIESVEQINAKLTEVFFATEWFKHEIEATFKLEWQKQHGAASNIRVVRGN